MHLSLGSSAIVGCQDHRTGQRRWADELTMSALDHFELDVPASTPSESTRYTVLLYYSTSLSSQPARWPLTSWMPRGARTVKALKGTNSTFTQWLWHSPFSHPQNIQPGQFPPEIGQSHSKGSVQRHSLVSTTPLILLYCDSGPPLLPLLQP